MLVDELMSRHPRVCHPGTDLASVTSLLWFGDVGVLPVVGEADGKVIGMITDRDVCIALGSRNRIASEVTAAEVMATAVVSCRPDDSVEAALETMKTARLRRLPVVDGEGSLVGILSLTDAILNATSANGVGAAALGALKAISAPHLPRLSDLNEGNESQEVSP